MLTYDIDIGNQNMLTVKQLIEKLSAMPPTAVVIVNGQSIDDVIGPEVGKLKAGYMNMNFSVNPKGEVKAVFLGKFTELSDSSIEVVKI